jgi:hypothetical protein
VAVIIHQRMNCPHALRAIILPAMDEDAMVIMGLLALDCLGCLRCGVKEPAFPLSDGFKAPCLVEKNEWEEGGNDDGKLEIHN